MTMNVKYIRDCVFNGKVQKTMSGGIIFEYQHIKRLDMWPVASLKRAGGTGGKQGGTEFEGG